MTRISTRGADGQMADETPSSATPVIAVAGCSSVDMTLRRVPPDWVGSVGADFYTHDMVQVIDDPPELGLGGNGGAAAYVMGALGCCVQLHGPIGDGAAGRLIKGWLSGANVQIVSPSRVSSMFSIIAVDDQSHRLGCLQYLPPRIDWVESARDGRAGWLLLGVHSQVGADELPEVAKALTMFQSGGGVTALDTGIGWTQTHTAEEMFAVWAHVDLLIGTLDELRFWTGLEDPQHVAERVLDAGVGRVVVKMGAQGAAFFTEDGRFMHQPARRVERSDVSIGAGDAFNGALISRLVRCEPMADAVAFAQTVASQVVEIGNGVIGWGDALRCES